LGSTTDASHAQDQNKHGGGNAQTRMQFENPFSHSCARDVSVTISKQFQNQQKCAVILNEGVLGWQIFLYKAHLALSLS
jgi:hypothetical protein